MSYLLCHQVPFPYSLVFSFLSNSFLYPPDGYESDARLRFFSVFILKMKAQGGEGTY